MNFVDITSDINLCRGGTPPIRVPLVNLYKENEFPCNLYNIIYINITAIVYALLISFVFAVKKHIFK